MPNTPNRQTRHRIVPASYVIPIQDDKILLLRRFNTGYEDGKYSLIAGHVDQNETFTHCIIREAEEEAGIYLQQEDIKVAHVMHRNSGTLEHNERIDIFFTAHSWRGAPQNKEPHKCDDMAWFPTNNLPENTIPYIRQAITSINDGMYYSEHGW